MTLSARNFLKGTIVRSSITISAVDELGLMPGEPTYSVMVGRD